ncbi:hypothetical protein [Paenibacillus terrae]|uniref:Uncharacterized protein n=1 Tax=Paenibacillus terrae TaxID=159743 RepID=A0A0D7WVX6_9BACL|nr:hypothetical protein [Paenibacillus terrae]KJD43310.1 hypothetical protein QD47_23415 [Paenibacillus terrae]
MGRPKPIEVHVNSKGSKHLVFQELLHAEDGYAFIPVDGRYKTDLYNQGLLDGRKRAVHFFSTLFECESPWVLILPFQTAEESLINCSFFGVVSLDQTYIVNMREAVTFLNNVCMQCEVYGTDKCYFSLSFDCGKDDREQYRDSAWFEMQREIRRKRKERVFPV